MLSVLGSGLCGPGSSPGRATVLFSIAKHISLIVPLPPRCINRRYYMATRGYKFYLRVLLVSLTSGRSELVRDTISTRR